MTYQYIVTINTDDVPPIIEQRITQIMTQFFNELKSKPLPDGVINVERREL